MDPPGVSLGPSVPPSGLAIRDITLSDVNVTCWCFIEKITVLSLVPSWVVLWQTLWQEYGLVTHATAHVTWKWEGTRSPTTKHPHFDLNYYAVDKQELMFWLLRWVRPLRGVDLDSILLLHFNTIIGVVSPMFLFQFSIIPFSVSITKRKTLLTLHHKPRFGNLNKKYPRESHTSLVKKQSTW